MHILVTRPQPEAARTAARLVALGHRVTVDPMLRIEPLNPRVPPGPFEAVALTSPAAARRLPQLAFRERIAGTRLFAVGRRTAEVVRAAGFPGVTAAEGDIEQLGAMLAAMLPVGARVLWIAGEDRAGDLAAVLAPHGIAVTLAVVYRAARVADLKPDTVAELAASRLDGALHYSQRTVETLLAAARRAGVVDRLLPLRHYALSEQVAAPLIEAGARVEVAERPEEQALLDLIATAPPSAAGTTGRRSDEGGRRG